MKRNYLKWNIFERDSYTCVLCERAATELHHVKHRSQGGTNAPDNLVSVCRFCHLTLHGQGAADHEIITAREYVRTYLADLYQQCKFG
jgi:5-methylcytosine-specific restriction endonuclease McrA